MRSLYLRLLASSLAMLVLIQAGGIALVLGWPMKHPSDDPLLAERLALVAPDITDVRDPRQLAHQGRRVGLRLAVVEPGSPGSEVGVRLANGWVLTGAPRGRPPPPVGTIALTVVLSVGAFGGLLWWLTRPVFRDLEVLERTTLALEHGALHARTGLREGPIATLGVRFDQMADRVESLVQGQRSLLQAVSHEMRTPQARMRFRLDALSTAGPDQRPALLRGLDTDLDAVDSLLQDLLELQRLDRRPEGEMVGAEGGDVVRAVVDRMRVLSPLPIDVEGSGSLPIGQRDLTRIVENLVSNAQRHAKSQIVVAVMAGGIAVSDDGPGVPAPHRERIFEPFASMDESRNRTLGGVGLGLAIARRAASRWGLRLVVGESALGGALFELRP